MLVCANKLMNWIVIANCYIMVHSKIMWFICPSFPELFHWRSVNRMIFWIPVILRMWPSDTVWRHRSVFTLAQLVAWRHQAITWTNVDFSLVSFWCIHRNTISHWVTKLLCCIMNLEIIFWKLMLNLSGANEFILEYLDKYNQYQTITIQNKVRRVCLFCGISCALNYDK